VTHCVLSGHERQQETMQNPGEDIEKDFVHTDVVQNILGKCTMYTICEKPDEDQC